MKDATPKNLDAMLAELPTQIAPSRDLWPQIARRAQPRRWFARPMGYAAAAAVAGACIAATLTWMVVHPRGAVPVLRMASSAQLFAAPRNAAYVAARSSLEGSFRERLALLDPATRARIEASLAVILQANEDIRQALAADPSSPVLEQLWQSTSRDELDLYERVVQGTQPTLTRT